jgi:hypothetical protein
LGTPGYVVEAVTALNALAALVTPLANTADIARTNEMTNMTVIRFTVFLLCSNFFCYVNAHLPIIKPSFQ